MDKMRNDLGPSYAAHLCLLWTQADWLLMPMLQNCIVGTLSTMPHDEVLCLEDHIERIWEETSTDSKLRKFIINAYDSAYDTTSELVRSRDLPRYILADILQQIDAERHLWHIWSEINAHDFHMNSDDITRSQCKIRTKEDLRRQFELLQSICSKARHRMSAALAQCVAFEAASRKWLTSSAARLEDIFAASPWYDIPCSIKVCAKFPDRMNRFDQALAVIAIVLTVASAIVATIIVFLVIVVINEMLADSIYVGGGPVRTFGG